MKSAPDHLEAHPELISDPQFTALQERVQPLIAAQEQSDALNAVTLDAFLGALAEFLKGAKERNVDAEVYAEALTELILTLKKGYETLGFLNDFNLNVAGKLCVIQETALREYFSVRLVNTNSTHPGLRDASCDDGKTPPVGALTTEDSDERPTLIDPTQSGTPVVQATFDTETPQIPLSQVLSQFEDSTPADDLPMTTQIPEPETPVPAMPVAPPATPKREAPEIRQTVMVVRPKVNRVLLTAGLIGGAALGGFVAIYNSNGPVQADSQMVASAKPVTPPAAPSRPLSAEPLSTIKRNKALEGYLVAICENDQRLLCADFEAALNETAIPLQSGSKAEAASVQLLIAFLHKLKTSPHKTTRGFAETHLRNLKRRHDQPEWDENNPHTVELLNMFEAN